MKNIVNLLFSILKIVLLFVSFVFVFYVTLSLCTILEKDVFSFVDVFIPYIILLVILLLNYVLKQRQITDNLFYNVSCCLVFIVIIFVCYRTIFDENMLIRYKNDYNMSFYYFLDMMKPLKAMFYLLIASNLCFMFTKSGVGAKIEPKSKIKVHNVK